MKTSYTLLLIASALLSHTVSATEKSMFLRVECDNLGHTLINFNPAPNHYAWIDQWGNRKNTEHFMEPIHTLLMNIPKNSSYNDSLTQDTAITTNADTNLNNLFDKLEQIRSNYTNVGWPTYFWRVFTMQHRKQIKTCYWQDATTRITVSDNVTPSVVLEHDTVFQAEAQEVMVLYKAFAMGLEKKS